MRTLKEEEVNGKTYSSLEDARQRIGAFLETVYNQGRLHSALGYNPPLSSTPNSATLKPFERTKLQTCPSNSLSQTRGAAQQVSP